MTLQQLGVTLLVMMMMLISDRVVYAFCIAQRHCTNAYSEACPAMQLVVWTHAFCVHNVETAKK